MTRSGRSHHLPLDQDLKARCDPSLTVLTRPTSSLSLARVSFWENVLTTPSHWANALTLAFSRNPVLSALYSLSPHLLFGGVHQTDLSGPQAKPLHGVNLSSFRYDPDSFGPNLICDYLFQPTIFKRAVAMGRFREIRLTKLL